MDPDHKSRRPLPHELGRVLWRWRIRRASQRYSPFVVVPTVGQLSPLAANATMASAQDDVETACSAAVTSGSSGKASVAERVAAVQACARLWMATGAACPR